MRRDFLICAEGPSYWDPKFQLGHELGRPGHLGHSEEKVRGAIGGIRPRRLKDSDMPVP